MIKSKAKLPDKLSELILVALEDLQVVISDDRYTVDLDDWHSPDIGDEHGTCYVCFAGAVIARRLSPAQAAEVIEPNDYDEHTKYRLHALNEVRRGNIAAAIWRLEQRLVRDIATAPEVGRVEGGDLDDAATYRLFTQQMRAVSKWLAERGL